MNKKVAGLFLGGLMMAVAPVFATRAGDQGVGLILGKPSGATYKMWIDDKIAVDGALGIDEGEFDIHADMLFHVFDWAQNLSSQPFKGITDGGDFPFYFGFGPRALFRDKTEIGIRIPVGLGYMPHQTTWEFFGEMAPVLRLTPSTGVDFDIAVGARYYFPAIHARSQ